MMVLRKLSGALLSLGVILPGLSHALTVGPDITVLSSLSQPFHGRVPLAGLGDLSSDDIHVSLATSEDFERMGIQKAYIVQELRFDVVVNPGGESYIDITTARPVVEPVLDFVLHVSWPNNDKLNDFVALLDPPGLPAPAPASAAPVAAPVVAHHAPEASAPVPDSRPERAPAPERPARHAHHGGHHAGGSAPATAHSALPSTGNTYRTRSSDTLWKVAKRVHPSGDVTVPQTMIALQNSNPDAFGDHNINQLKKGQVLQVPSDEQIRAVSAAEALDSVRSQTKAWREGVKLGAAQVNATADAGHAGKPADAGKAKMTLSASEGGGHHGVAGAGTTGKPLNPSEQAELKANQVKAASLKDENKKLGATAGSLDSKLKDTSSQLDVENAKLAKLQSQLQAKNAKAGSGAGSVAADQSAASAPAASAAATSTSGDQASATAASAAGSQVVKHVVPVKKPIVDNTPTPTEDSSGMSNTILAVIVGAVLALLAFFGYRFTRKTPPPAKPLTSGATPNARPEASGTDAPVRVAPEAPAVVAPVAAAPQPVAADPLQEVEQYIAFERYPQAIGFLNKAISTSPDRTDLRLKLMEVYARLKDQKGFDEQEAALASSNDLSVLARIEELRSALPPRAREAKAEPSAAAQSAGSDLPSLEELEMDFNATVSASSPNLKALESAPALEPVSIKPPKSNDFDMDMTDLSGDLDFTLDGAEPAPAPQAVKPVDAPKAAIAADELSFNLDDMDLDGGLGVSAGHADLGSFKLDDVADFGDESKPSPATAAKPLEADDLSFSLDDLDSLAKPAESAAKSELALDSNWTDDLSLDHFDAESTLVTQAPATHEADLLEGDFSLHDASPVSRDADELKLDHVMAESDLNDKAADFDLGLSEQDHLATMPGLAIADSTRQAPAAAAPASTAAPAGEAGLGLDDEFDFLADADENATKLDLARAYIDMGDLEGARDILQEVVTEGNSAQQDEARQLLSQVG